MWWMTLYYVYFTENIVFAPKGLEDEPSTHPENLKSNNKGWYLFPQREKHWE